MERLTDRENGGAYFKKCFEEPCNGEGGGEKCEKCDVTYQVCDKLCDYEDAEENGLLLRLPCKVGDTLYIISRGEIIPLVVEYFTFSERGIRIFGMNERYFGNGTITLYPDKRIVEWFLTQAEAEQALKRLESEQK